MSHANARLTLHGRRLLVARVLDDHRPVAHVAKELGVSRQCAHRWVRRFRAEGAAGLSDRSSRPLQTPTKTSPEREAAVLAARAELRFGPVRLAAKTGVPARTISRILRRHQVPPLAWLDPITGAPIRATRATTNRYEHEHPGDMVHIDVKKLGRIPDGGGWRVHGREANTRDRKNPIGFDYVHAAVDDHSRLAYAEIHPDEKGATAAGFLTRAAAYFTSHGVTRIERGDLGQRVRLPTLDRVQGRRRCARREAEVHQAALPLAERESRALQPDARNRVGLPATLHQQPSPSRCPCALDRALQH